MTPDTMLRALDELRQKGRTTVSVGMADLDELTSFLVRNGEEVEPIHVAPGVYRLVRVEK